MTGGTVGGERGADGGGGRRGGRAAGHADDVGNAGAVPGVYSAMRTPAASTPSSSVARRRPAGRSAAYPPGAAPPPGSRAGSPTSGADPGPEPPQGGLPGAGDTRAAGADRSLVSIAGVDGTGPSPDGLHGGGEDGFAAFYRDAWPGVARALGVALGDRDLAIEATDEAMARAYARWKRLSSYDNPGAWVYRVGLNWARSYRRRLARRPPAAARTDVDLPPVGDPAVRAALLSLPIAQRSVVVCRLLLDWSVDDTATALGIRPATVRTRQHRALRSLNDALGPER